MDNIKYYCKICLRALENPKYLGPIVSCPAGCHYEFAMRDGLVESIYNFNPNWEVIVFHNYKVIRVSFLESKEITIPYQEFTHELAIKWKNKLNNYKVFL